MATAFGKGDTVVFAGDSITDAGRTLEHGAVDGRLLGEGYVRDVAGLIPARYPDHRPDVHNVGIGGITSRQLLQLWDDQVLAREPQWVSLLIGINDCNLRIGGDERGVPAEEYAANCREMVRRTTDAGARMVLLDPFYMWPADQPGDPQQGTLSHLKDYIAAIAGLATEFGTLHVPTHDTFSEQLQHPPLAKLGIEPVHPTPTGHLVIAHAFLQVTGW